MLYVFFFDFMRSLHGIWILIIFLFYYVAYKIVLYGISPLRTLFKHFVFSFQITQFIHEAIKNIKRINDWQKLTPIQGRAHHNQHKYDYHFAVVVLLIFSYLQNQDVFLNLSCQKNWVLKHQPFNNFFSIYVTPYKRLFQSFVTKEPVKKPPKGN